MRAGSGYEIRKQPAEATGCGKRPQYRQSTVTWRQQPRHRNANSLGTRAPRYDTKKHLGITTTRSPDQLSTGKRSTCTLRNADGTTARPTTSNLGQTRSFYGPEKLNKRDTASRSSMQSSQKILRRRICVRQRQPELWRLDEDYTSSPRLAKNRLDALPPSRFAEQNFGRNDDWTSLEELIDFGYSPAPPTASGLCPHGRLQPPLQPHCCLPSRRSYVTGPDAALTWHRTPSRVASPHRDRARTSRIHVRYFTEFSELFYWSWGVKEMNSVFVDCKSRELKDCLTSCLT